MGFAVNIVDVEVDVSYHELNTTGAHFLETVGADFAPYFVALNQALVKAGGRDNLPIREYYERLAA